MRCLCRPVFSAVPLLALTLLGIGPGGAKAPRALPQLVGGALPAQISTVVGWEQARAALSVDKRGKVTAVHLMDASPGFERRVKTALAAWTFHPATGPKGPIPSHVLVVVIYRPPVLYNAPTLGNPMRRLTPWPPTVPYPIRTRTPMYPPQAAGNATVLVSLDVGADGTPTRTRIVGAPSGFDSASLAAVRAWRFRPAKPDGTPAPALACVVFGFRRPVTQAPVR